MKNVVDPANNFAFEVHQYLDGNYSGTSGDCQSTTIGVEKLADFTNWARENKFKGFLGEFAGGNNSTCRAATENMLDFVEANKDVWIGWTWWAAGPWWGEYRFTIEPTNCGAGDPPSKCIDRPQMDWLEPYL